MPKCFVLNYFKDLKFYSQKGFGSMVKNDDRWLFIGEICAHLGVSSDIVYKWIEKQGLLRIVWAGGEKVKVTIFDMNDCVVFNVGYPVFQGL